MSKRCSRCLEVQSLNEFPDQKGECIKCNSLYRQEERTGEKATEYKKPKISVMRKVDELLSLSMDHYVIAQKIIDLAIDGDKEMIKFIVERQDGKVKDNVSIEHSGEVNSTNTTINVVATADELRSKIRGQLMAPKTILSTPNQSTDNGPTSTH